MAERLGASGLTRVFPGGSGVSGIDLSVMAGEVHALVGLNGAGKTTLMRLLLGMLQPDAGTVRIDGHDLPTMEPSDWGRVGHMVGHSLAYPELRTRANLRLAARLHGIAPGDLDAVVDASIVELDLGAYAEVRVGVLSAGNRQRVGLAAAMSHHPDLIVLDEPTSALDPRGVIVLREALLRRTAAGSGVLVSSHHLDEVARIADRITVVNQGMVIGSLQPGIADIERAFFDMVLESEAAR